MNVQAFALAVMLVATILGASSASAGSSKVFGRVGGNANISIAAVVEFGSGSVSIDQNSRVNLAKVIQIGGTVDSTIVQTGDRNVAGVFQIGSATASTIAQFGGVNQASVKQVGVNNALSLVGQLGVMNTGIVRQSAPTTFSAIWQFGR
jgi:minor curlin subunit